MISKEPFPLTLLKYASLVFGVFVVLFPPYIIVLNAFKTKDEYLTSGAMDMPESFFYFRNFLDAFEKANLDLAFGNTVLLIGMAVAGNILLGSMFCYAVGRFEFRFRNGLVGLYMFAMLIPMITTQVVNYKTIQTLGLTNNFFGPTLLYIGADVIQIFIYLQFIRNIPYELDESALIEGASFAKIYRSIIFPLLVPATVTIIILKTIAIYNDMFIPYLYLSKPDFVVVSTSLMRFFALNSGDWRLVSAAILMILIPTSVMYLFLQRYIFSGVTSGAVK